MHDLALALPSSTDHGAAACDEEAATARGFENAVCMTIYNESLVLLRSSLSALIASIDAARREMPTRETRSCIVIIVDGEDRADAEVLRFFQRAGLADTGFAFPALGETVHLSRHCAAAIMAALGVHGEVTGELHFALCVKACNRGKLHSHALFFRGICPVLRPELCYQIDVGTVVEAGAVDRLVAFMKDRPNVAAAASRILTPTPGNAAGTLSVWQYMDFVSQKAVMWPTELASGYLSVIPGQFCVFRWSAVSARPSDDGGERPLDTYLRGLSAVAPLERVMFLAEDRVFGNEIVLARDKSWRIGYCPTAEATTDACDTFQELLRQRRRWQNSALAVRLWLWGRWPSYLLRQDKSLFDKARFTTAMLWQGLLTACEVISPAFLLLLVCAGIGVLLHSKHPALTGTTGSALGTTAALAWLTLRDPSSRWRSALCLARDMAAALTVGLLAGCTLYLLPPLQAGLLLAPAVIMAAVIAVSFPGQRWSALSRLPLYLLADRLISLALYGYALANVHNVTWGTKGLISNRGDAEAEQRRMRRLRDATAGSILGIDAALVFAGLNYSGRWITSASCVVELFTFLCLAVVSNAAVVWLVSACGSLHFPRLAALASFLRKGAAASRAAIPVAFAQATRAG